jgi:hypothetical protein
MEHKRFKQDAKQIVDMTFDAKVFKDNLTRDDLNAIEDMLEFILQSRFDSYLKMEKITRAIQARKP